MNPQQMLKEYEYGVGFKYGDILKLRPGKYCSWEIVDDIVVVLQQNILNPSKYLVLAEPTPKNQNLACHGKYMKFDINGHDWEKTGESK